MRALKKYISIFIKTFLGPALRPIPSEDLGLAFQYKCLRKVWDFKSFGLIRLLRLFLCVIPFVFPLIYFTSVLKKCNATTNLIHSFSDLYVIIRIGILFLFLLCDINQNWWITGFTIYLFIDFLTYVSAFIFLADIYGRPFYSYRTLLFFLINFGEAVIVFAIFHRQWGGLNIDPLCSIQALYFSTVTSTTLGFGDINPVNSSAQLRVIAQIFVSVVFLSVFISDALSRIGSLHKKR